MGGYFVVGALGLDVCGLQLAFHTGWVYVALYSEGSRQSNGESVVMTVDMQSGLEMRDNANTYLLTYGVHQLKHYPI